MPAAAAALARTPRREPIAWRVREAISAYLPLLLMALLALATWWLVDNTPEPPPERAAVAPRHEPDYTMQRFTLQRYDAAGRLVAEVEGEQLRHYPDDDTLEIDAVRIRAIGADGAVTVATARRGVAQGDGSAVELLGGARVVSEGGARAPVQFEGERLRALIDAERVISPLPVRAVIGSNEIRAAGLDYDRKTQQARLLGPMRARFDVSGRARR
jgi:lipopolysaccharide export system protein LptC